MVLFKSYSLVVVLFLHDQLFSHSLYERLCKFMYNFCFGLSGSNQKLSSVHFGSKFTSQQRKTNFDILKFSLKQKNSAPGPGE